MRNCILFIILILFSGPEFISAQTKVNFTINYESSSLTGISQYIYSSNPMQSGVNFAGFRYGGNRWTGYNWENNYSSAGTDWYNWNDNYLPSIFGLGDVSSIPAAVLINRHNAALGNGANSLVTIQMAGYVAKDGNHEVTLEETAPSSRWVKVKAEKGSAFSLNPDANDSVVHIDELINKLVNEFGYAGSENGIKFYDLDNEPALWSSTHIRIHPAKPTCREIVEKGIEFANAIKNVDPDAKILGPVLYGFSAFTDFQGASDWNSVKSGKDYKWFIDYYLDEMRKAEITYGKRLLDVLDIHWYPEAQGDNRISSSNANTNADKLARLQAPRTLWQDGYIEKSWIGQWFSNYLPLLPKLQASIDKYYPGTKLAVSEFNYGGENDITGGIAFADVLGIFAKYGVEWASYWAGNENSEYVYGAYKIYRNYDGSNSEFGNRYVPSESDSVEISSVYSSLDPANNKLHIIAINKDLENTIKGSFRVNGSLNISGSEVWCLDGSSVAIKQINFVNNLSENSFSYELPKASVCHFIFDTNIPVDVAELPEIYDLKIKAYPNPFNPAVNIEYNIPDRSFDKIEIYDMLGRLVKTFDNINKSGKIVWNGTNNSNNLVSSGIYNVVFRGSNAVIASKKIMLVK